MFFGQCAPGEICARGYPLGNHFFCPKIDKIDKKSKKSTKIDPKIDKKWPKSCLRTALLTSDYVFRPMRPGRNLCTWVPTREPLFWPPLPPKIEKIKIYKLSIAIKLSKIDKNYQKSTKIIKKSIKIIKIIKKWTKIIKNR
jgi:hypothetical protein